MKRYKMMSARKFLQTLPSLLKDGYKGNYYTPCISERFLKKVRKEMRLGADESLTNIYIFCNGYTLNPREQKNSGIYIRDCKKYYEVIMCRLHKPILSGEDFIALASLNDAINEENSSEEKNLTILLKDTDLLDNLANKKIQANSQQTVFQNFASCQMQLFFL